MPVSENKVDLMEVWNRRKEMLAARSKLRAEGYKLRAEGDRSWTEGDRNWAEGLKLHTKEDLILAEGNLMWAEAVLAVHGNIKIKWISDTHCRLGTGEDFR